MIGGNLFVPMGTRAVGWSLNSHKIGDDGADDDGGGAAAGGEEEVSSRVIDLEQRKETGSCLEISICNQGDPLTHRTRPTGIARVKRECFNRDQSRRNNEDTITRAQTYGLARNVSQTVLENICTGNFVVVYFCMAAFRAVEKAPCQIIPFSNWS